MKQYRSSFEERPLKPFKKRWIRLKTLALGLVAGSVALPISIVFAAASDSQAHNYDVGGVLGPAFMNHDIGTHVTWGLTAHALVMPNLNLGLWYNRYTNDTTVLAAGGTKYTTSYNNIAAEANYLMSDLFEGAYVGAKLGFSIRSISLPNSSANYNMVFGPAVGYDYMLGNGISVGGQFNILWTTGDPFFSDTNLLAVLKYNF